jgi:cell wall-associated NlpC family hydrolase
MTVSRTASSTRWALTAAASVELFVVFAGTALRADPEVKQAPAEKAYRSPYSVKFTVPAGELMEDIEKGQRGDPRRQSSVAVGDWYSKETRAKWGAWGPPTAQYSAPDKLAGRSLTWKRERVVAVALRFQGYGYQHHHVPDWEPPEGWPWKETAVGKNGKGVDCSNFSSFVYNLGFGIRPLSNVKEQSARLDMTGPGEGKTTKAERIKLPEAYADVVRTLRTGDLLFIRNRDDEISHVVIWVGSISRAANDVPLVIDSHGQGLKDAEGTAIPYGVQLRPFREKGWYFKSASHAIRIWRDE